MFYCLLSAGLFKNKVIIPFVDVLSNNLLGEYIIFFNFDSESSQNLTNIFRIRAYLYLERGTRKTCFKRHDLKIFIMILIFVSKHSPELEVFSELVQKVTNQGIFSF